MPIRELIRSSHRSKTAMCSLPHRSHPTWPPIIIRDSRNLLISVKYSAIAHESQKTCSTYGTRTLLTSDGVCRSEVWITKARRTSTLSTSLPFVPRPYNAVHLFHHHLHALRSYCRRCPGREGNCTLLVIPLNVFLMILLEQKDSAIDAAYDCTPDFCSWD